MVSIFSLVLAALWAIGIAASYTLGGYLHVLLLLAIALPVIRFLTKRSQKRIRTNHESRIHLKEEGSST
jgi:uncharacterized membrane protein